MKNSELEKLVGRPCNLTEGCHTKSTANPKKGDLGMGKFNPRSGANNNGRYIVTGGSK